ncbi:MAG: Mu-like prophage major head subunit gpT family protein [Gammaproteobacteria bacterium]|nr:Mu-like prophage major head subunit gpT family protein [Gammaproteobacteria bacterium]
MSAQGLGSRAIIGRMWLRLEQGAAGWVNRLSMEIDSDQESETHKWLGMSPQMREWIGGRLVHGLREFGVTIENKDFEATIEILTKEIRRDKTGQIMIRVDNLADRVNSHGAKLLTELVVAGESSVCYDGQFFFDTDHAEGSSGTQSNDITTDISALPIPADEQGSPTVPSSKVMRSAILRSVQQMYGFKDDQGEPMNEGASEFLIMVPTPFWEASVTAVNLPTLNNESNLIPNLPGLSFSVLPNPRLPWTDKFATFRADMSDGVKPFIKQEEQPLNVSAQAENSPEEFYNKRHVYGVDWIGNYGYGFWQHACLNQLV